MRYIVVRLSRSEGISSRDVIATATFRTIPTIGPCRGVKILNNRSAGSRIQGTALPLQTRGSRGRLPEKFVYALCRQRCRRTFKGVRLKRTMAIVVLLSFVLSPAFAGDRTEKIHALMQAQGLVETFDQMIATVRVNGRAQANQVLSQMLNELNPNETFRARFIEASDAFVEAMQPPWGAKEIVDVWSDYYGSQFSDAELDQLLVYYTSALAQKEVNVSRSALSRFTAHFQEKYKPVVQAATASYVARLKAISSECNCTK